MKSLITLWNMLALESADRCCTSATMDLKRVQVRLEHEGFSFLSITLPRFGSDFEVCLDRGFVDRDLFKGFSWRAGLPRFLGGFLDLVFDRCDGTLLDEPLYDAILAVRQLTLMYSKILLPCSEKRVRRSMSGFVQCEQEVKENWDALETSYKSDFSRISALLFRDLFVQVDSDIYYGRLVPRHGPGATADGLRGNAKFRQSTWTTRLDTYFPVGEFLLPSYSFYDTLNEIDFLEPGAELPVRVVPVPKTQKGPRIIAIEPTCMQYAQQAVLRSILESLRGSDYLKRFIGIRDQIPNQEMALKGSSDGFLATLDLSEASDRVSNQLVQLMLANHPHLRGAVDACRSRTADVPGEGLILLSKFASMGSALTFPVEAMVFLTTVFVGIEKELKVPLTRRVIRTFLGQVRVYGDDIIVPTEYVRSVVDSLGAYGFLVNSRKSFWNGKFRESCGKEYYEGQDVSIVKVRRVFPTQPKHAEEVISIVSLRNQLYWAGYWQTVRWLDDYIKGIIKQFPMVESSSPVLGRQSALGHMAERTGRLLHDPQVKGYVVDAKIPSDPLDGPGALLKCLLRLGVEDDPVEPEMARPDVLMPYTDNRHLEHAGRPHAVNIKLRWASAI